MTPQKIDCALIFAIEEEFNILKDNKEIIHKEGINFSFEFLDKNGIQRECIVTYVSKMGSHEAYKFLADFNRSYDPFMQFIIGISGQLSDDLKIGDICIASTIDKYDYNSKQKDGIVSFSGETKNLSFSEDIFSRLPTMGNLRFTKWQKKSSIGLDKQFNKIQISELVDKKFIRNNNTPTYFFGKIASGEGVVDDPVLKKAIQNKDRKLLCVDMESFGFADANDDKENLVIIRAISDTSDGRKKELDNFGGNIDAIRKWALQNAYDLFHDVILKTVTFPEDMYSVNDHLFKSSKIDRFDKLAEKHGIEIFTKYSNLINHLILRTPNEEIKQDIFEHFANVISQISNESTVFVQGLPSSGKTTFLYLLYKYLNLNEHNCDYINIHLFKNDTSTDSVERFELNINRLVEGSKSRYLIIDGIDQFERLFVNTEINLNNHWGRIAEKFEVIILGITLQDYENEEDDRFLYYLPEPKIQIELKNFEFDTPNIDSLLNDLLFINNQTLDKLPLLKKFISDTNLKELDWYSTNLIVKRVGRFKTERVTSLGRFFFNFSKEYFSKYSLNSIIKEVSDMTFRKFIKEQNLTEDEYKSPLWKFIQRSNSIKQFLISEHLVDKYSNLDEDFENSISDLKHIYSYKINSYFKDNINRNNRIQEKILESIKKRYSQLNLLQKPNICYIIGRLQDEGLRIDGRRFLNQQLDSEIALYERGEYVEDESQYRQHLLLIRTIFISLVYLHDKNASSKYLKFLLADQGWDDLNRGFHLEYYGDKPYDPLKLGLHNDDLEINFVNTYTRLSKRINNVILNPERNYYLMIDIELQTITSLAVNRHLKGKLDAKIRMDIISILKEFINNQVHLIKNIEFRPFIDFSLYILSKEDASIFEIVKDINRIKNTARTGWNYEGSRDHEKIVRTVHNAESVAAHVYGTMIMALLFLPDEIPQDNTYSKTDVIKTILIHDLAEAFTGDIRTFEKTDSDREDEDDIMRRIFAAQIIKGFANLEEYKTLWKNYKSQNTTTARIAREMDKIEQLYQLDIYKLNKDNIISDYVKWRTGNIRLIDSTIGKGIISSLYSNESL